MILSPMRYKNYVWPHNPRVYEAEFKRDLAVNKVPFGRYFMQDMGVTYRILQGEGEFVGPDAYKEFKKLASIFYEDSPGILIHPVWQSSCAYFAELKLKQEPFRDYVRYSFAFWETYNGYTEKMCNSSRYSYMDTETAVSGEDSTYVVKSGDTLWAIAKRNDMSLETLLEKNPQFKNPNLIYPGDTVHLE